MEAEAVSEVADFFRAFISETHPGKPAQGQEELALDAPLFWSKLQALQRKQAAAAPRMQTAAAPRPNRRAAAPDAYAHGEGEGDGECALS